jgi:GDP-4-dehydro-6-deoxy-D-mannose reductase
MRSGGVVVTGANGFVGRHVVAAIRREQPDRRILALGGASAGDAGIDLGRPETIRRALDGFEFDTVVHLAAQASVGSAIHSPAETWRVNVLGTINLAEVVAAASPGATLIHAGSAESYGASFLSGEPLGENAPLRPANAYARGKVAAEMVLEDLRPAVGGLVLLRLFNHTGPGQDERFVAPSFAAQIARIEKSGKPGVVKVGDLSACRDFGDIEDAADAIAMIAGAEGLAPVSTFNICSGVSRPVSDVLNVLVSLADQKVEVEVDPDRLRPSAIPVAAGSHEALTRALGWRPTRRFEDLMSRLLDYWRIHG